MYFILTVPVDDPNCKCLDISKAKTILGREPMADIHENLTNTNVWLKDNQMKA
jgi:nucleoside-diphosphate-sugar epimerase